MKKAKIYLSLFIVLLATTNMAFAQNQATGRTYWNDADESSQDIIGERLIDPLIYRTVAIDFTNMRNAISTAPNLYSGQRGVLINLPLPDGGNAAFEVFEASIMMPGLQAKFPEIRSFAGFRLDRKADYLRFDISPKGFRGMILSAEGRIFIDPLFWGQTNFYQVYYTRDDVKDPDDQFVCEVESDGRTPDFSSDNRANSRAGDCILRTYRLAVAATAEYTSFHGGTVLDAMTAINTSMVRVNGVYEKDLGITMVLVDDNDQVVYTNASTDPYTNGSGSTMLGENQSNLDAVIGSSNYDIGHVFSTGGGGIAGLRVPCKSSSKARGVTGLNSPVGDTFDIDYVAHEMGHQYGGNHTQNNSCNRNNSTAMEPGSASTIMGYAGICSPNVQNNSDDIFHGISIQEMESYTTDGTGDNCPLKTNTGNNAPSVNAGADYTVPVSTPLRLTAVASDPDPDILTYAWEQFDNAVANMPPEPTNSDGPAFRSIQPLLSPARYLPNLDAVVNNTTPTWEVLPSVTRDMNFRITVRDNQTGNGCTAEDDMVISYVSAAGPFELTSPNTAVTWTAGDLETVTWDVAGTNSAPVSSPDVDIFLSLDGGFTYPITLAESVPNDGSQEITVPSVSSTSARVQVFSSNNIFYDISNTDFIIENPVSICEEGALVDGLQAVSTVNGTNASLSWNMLEGATAYQAKGRRLGTVPYGQFVTANNFKNVGGLMPATSYEWMVRAQCEDGSILAFSEMDTFFTLSPIVRLEDSEGGLMFRVFPNPASENINIAFNTSSLSQDATISIIDILGKEILTQRVDTNNGILNVGVEGLTNGVYFITMQVGDLSESRKFTISR